MKIGFIDYNLNNYHANKFHGIFTSPPLAADVEVALAYESKPQGDDWCAAKNVKRADSAEEVVDACDGILILAPDNPDMHPELSREALKSGKPVFIDKTLAHTMEDAKQMLSRAAENKTPVMCSSSLRFSVELKELLQRLGDDPTSSIFSRGFGKWRGYAVHTIAPAIRLLKGAEAKRLIDTGTEKVRLVTLEAEGGKRAFIEVRESENQMEATPWQVGVLWGDRYDVVQISKYDEFYANLMKEVLEFFRSGKSPVPPEEQLTTLAVEIAADVSLSSGNKWVELGG